MFKNCVFKVSVNTKRWIKATAIRMIKTGAEVMAAGIATGAAMSEINWAYLASTACVAMIASGFISLAGIPEVSADEE